MTQEALDLYHSARRREAAGKSLRTIFYSLVTVREAIKAVRKNPENDIAWAQLKHTMGLVDRDELDQAARDFELVDGTSNRITVLQVHLQRSSRRELELTDLKEIEKVILDLCLPVAELLK